MAPLSRTEFSDRFGPWAVVTGAAQGVGLAFAENLVDRGLGVVLVDRNREVAEVAAGLEGEARGVVADLGEPRWLQAVADATTDVEVGLAVANAGVSHIGRYLDMTDQQKQAMLRVNIDATVAMADWALPSMVERGRGGFVVTSSGSALCGTGGVGLYSATKAFSLNFAEALGWELCDTGVVTQAVVAPLMATPGFASTPSDTDATGVPAVDPRGVVGGALDALGTAGAASCWYADGGLELVASSDRREAVGFMSSTTTAMYPSVFPDWVD